jgi:hypothetical protein
VGYASDGTYVQRKPGSNAVTSTHEILLQDPWGLSPRPSDHGDGANPPPAARPAARTQSGAPTSSS